MKFGESPIKWLWLVIAAAASASLAEGVALDPQARAIFAEVRSRLEASVVPEATYRETWTEAAFERDIRETGSVFAALRRQLERSRTSHTGIFSPEDVEYYDLADIFFFRGRPPPEALEIYGEKGPSYVGIGAWFKSGGRGDGYTVTQVFPNTPAATAGLRPGDIVVAIDGKEFKPVSRYFREKAVQGLTVLRGGRTSRIMVTPERILPVQLYRRATKLSVERATLNGRDVGYIRLYSFVREEDMQALRDLLTAGELRGIQALVLDLRGGWGGTPMDYAAPFVGGFPTQTVTGADGQRRESGWNWCKPVVVIVDGTTRSGKEVFAEVLKLNGVPIVGSRTAGEVLSTRPYVLKTSKWLLELPHLVVAIGGRHLEGAGVTPTVPVIPAPGTVDRLKEAGLKLAAERMDTASRPICKHAAGGA